MRDTIVGSSAECAPRTRASARYGVRRADERDARSPQRFAGIIATVPKRLAELYRQNPAIRLLPPPREIRGFKCLMIWHPRLPSDAAHVWLRRLISRSAAELGKGRELFAGHRDRPERGARAAEAIRGLIEAILLEPEGDNLKIALKGDLAGMERGQK